jgi:hypothetical protein
MKSSGNNIRRFAVALSFPGEHRLFAKNVAKRLAEVLGRDRVFFDEWYESLIRGSDADLKLKRVYREDSDLVIPFFSENYLKMWCQIEWKAIRSVLAERRSEDAVLPVHIDGTRIEGWESIDLGIRKGRKSGRNVADAIIEVYQQRLAIVGKIPIDESAEPHPLRQLLRDLKLEYASGDLRDSLIAPIVISALTLNKCLELSKSNAP